MCKKNEEDQHVDILAMHAHYKPKHVHADSRCSAMDVSLEDFLLKPPDPQPTQNTMEVDVNHKNDDSSAQIQSSGVFPYSGIQL